MKVKVILFLVLIPLLLITFATVDYISKSSLSSFIRSFRHESASDLLTCPKCNIILLNIEMLRVDHLGVFNPNAGLSPNIDEFFTNAIQFSDAVSASGATYLSATATTTGTEAMLNSHYFGLLSGKKPGGGSWRLLSILAEQGERLIDRIPSIAETLADNRYATIGMNDWIHSGPEVYLDRGFNQYVQTPLLGSLFEEQIETALTLLRKTTQQPFLFYMHSNALHFNFYFPADYQPHNSDVFERLKPYTKLENSSKIVRARAPGVNLSDAWRAYAEQIKYIDSTLETLFDYIEKRLSNNTIVVLFSHHGVGSRTHNKLGVGLPYQEFVHVPLLIRHPNISRKMRIDRMVSLVDLPATLYTMIDIDPPHELITFTLASLLSDEHYPRKFTYTRDFQHESIRKAHWKLIYKGGVPAELYNLLDDPGEINNKYDPTLPIAQELSVAMYKERLRQLDYSKRLENTLQ